ncbi:hypothetical protein D3C87_464970 [compost metagenome]
MLIQPSVGDVLIKKLVLKMKKLLILLSIFLIGNWNAQVIFGDAVGSATNKTSVLMEFANTGNRGMILPCVTNKAGITTPGSMILDATVRTAAKVEYYNGTTWFDLSSGQTANVTAFAAIQPIALEKPSAKVVIGSETSAADGILVLESATKAMVLPVVSSHNNIVNPSPGMMVIVNGGGIKTLAFYNGSKWAFWNY